MAKSMLNSILMVLVLTVITGIVYPLAMTGLAQALLPAQANGSLVSRDGVVVGSMLIGQPFSTAAYFHSRPSAAGPDGYDASGSGGSNLGPTNQKLKDSASERLAAVRTENSLPAVESVPGDLILASASGLDPHISPKAAYIQIERVATARGLSSAQVQSFVYKYTEGRQFGFLGEPRVNVLALNLALDAEK